MTIPTVRPTEPPKPLTVILAHENRRQIPQLRNVVHLKHLALIRRTITIQREAHRLLAVVLRLQRNANAQRHLRSNNTVATVEILRIHMHRAALAARAARRTARQLAQHTLHRFAHQIRPTVATVRRDDAVILAHRRRHANGARLLAGIQMAEAAHDFLLVQAARGRFDAPDGEHLLVVLERIVTRQRHIVGRSVGEIVQLVVFRCERRFGGVVVRRSNGWRRALWILGMGNVALFGGFSSAMKVKRKA